MPSLLVELQASGMSWSSIPVMATHINSNVDNNIAKIHKCEMILRRNGVSRHENSTQRETPRSANWHRNSKGLLLCALGQYGCSDSHHRNNPDTVGTWKFHKVSRQPRCGVIGSFHLYFSFSLIFIMILILNIMIR